ncbi:MAG: DUF5110 domain-containing protein [Chitinophagaceae bacterium]|nr:MAG: DUF5110 domain-containing protein [Chitinophagaceae bacterium]
MKIAQVFQLKKTMLLALVLIGWVHISQAQKSISVSNADQATFSVTLKNGKTLYLGFYGNNIFRVYMDTLGGSFKDPVATPPAQILVNNPYKKIDEVIRSTKGNIENFSTPSISIDIDQTNGLIKVFNKKSNKLAFEMTEPFKLEPNKTSFNLKENKTEQFFGGGVQNGRFTHKGKTIAIENQNSWTDGGVASPTPFYWSTNGYGVMFYTFKKGQYDFGNKTPGKVQLYHETAYLDVFFMVNEGMVPLLNDFYQLTGNPVLVPKFGFYEGHLNAYNRDYWTIDSTGKGVPFEDGKTYKESQKDNGGIKESLNGELKNNYQFSARAVIDRYKKHDMPLGWILPNDGYGAGYGQTSTLDSNINNLKTFGEYARKNGVQIGLWTQSDLHPKEGISALLQRDIIKEVRDAGVRVLKTDVAWVGAGYSFGLNGVADVGTIMPKYGNNARPFIISLDGWAGTQRYATIWSGDQTGGQWEYIRFHIPTYLGSGLSGQPNITSDMDGIFGGKNTAVNMRDFQWKTFTPMQLNMDGWGSNEKYPHALGEPATSINRMYLKWKSELMPYAYSIAKESVDGLPMIRAMFIEQPNAFTYSKATQYQYLYGPSFLIAPIYQNTHADEKGNDIRNNIYLPKGKWIDYFNGNVFDGDKIINNFEAPIWKLPVFVKQGAIIPLTNPNNNPSEINKKHRIYELYPSGKTNFTEYDDDGTTEEYMQGKGATTLIESELLGNTATLTIYPTKGNFNGFEKRKSTELRFNVTAAPKSVTAIIDGKKIFLKKVKTMAELNAQQNVYFYNTAPELNNFATNGSDFSKISIKKNPMVYVKLNSTDISKTMVKVLINGFRFEAKNNLFKSVGYLTSPTNTRFVANKNAAFNIQPTWEKVANADFYEIKFNNMLYSTITDTTFILDDLSPETNYSLQLRAANKNGYSPWVNMSHKTAANPLEFAIQGIYAQNSVADQSGTRINNLFDFDETKTWHTKWSTAATPFTVTIDLKTINTLDKLQYLPREDASNGTLLSGKISYSLDKTNWVSAGNFNWQRTGDTKEFKFSNQPIVRYIKIEVDSAVGKYGSGREMYIFKVPGTPSYLPGDINNDKTIDHNDLTSYLNYTGLKKGDGDFDGYISNGDINKNNIIDAYDISVVATQLDGAVSRRDTASLKGSLEIIPNKTSYKTGEEIILTVKGNNLQAINALGFALPYNPQDIEFIKIEPLGLKNMENFTNDRLHSNKEKVLYPTFVNVGNKETLNGTSDLFIIKLKAKRNIKADFKIENGILVSKSLNSIQL